jgi:Holliday junction resolvase RusA-like endonuclease
VKSYQKLHLLQSADKRPKIAQFKYTNREDTSNYGTDIGDKMRKRLGIFSDQNLISEVEIKCNGNRWKIKIRQNNMNYLPAQ